MIARGQVLSTRDSKKLFNRNCGRHAKIKTKTKFKSVIKIQLKWKQLSERREKAS
jgi:hypothetical protein